MFLSEGVKAVSIEAIASGAGVSKVTVYGTYTDKFNLFRHCIKREMDRIEASQGLVVGTTAQPRTTSLPETLRIFGVGIMTFLATDTAISFYGLLGAELRQTPDLARAFWDIGPGKTKQNLAAILYDAAQRGELRIDNADEAAEILMGMWQGFSNYQLALGLGSQRETETIELRVERGIEVFMRAYSLDVRT
jgi:TetR/AcrR family transcriptional regulator, mexJK operon transcriptional repressor